MMNQIKMKILSYTHTMCGTPLILSHEPNNIVRYNLKRPITIGKIDQYKGSFASYQVELGLFGVPRVTRGLVS